MKLWNRPELESRSFLPTRIRAMSLLVSIVLFAWPADVSRAACAEGAVNADCVSMDFVANVSAVVDPAGLYGSVGPTVSGTLSFDSGIMDADPVSNLGEYPRSLECAFVDVGDFAFESILGVDDNSDSNVAVENDATNNGQSFADAVAGAISAFAVSDFVIAGAGAVAYSYSDFCIQILGDCPVTLVTSDAFPPAPGAIGMSTSFQVEFVSNQGQTATVLGEIVSLTSAPPIACPEPSLGSGLAATLALLGAFGRRAREAIS